MLKTQTENNKITFLQQEPGATPEEIVNGIRYVRPGGGFQHKLTELFEKIDVNGANEDPFYTYLKVSRLSKVMGI